MTAESAVARVESWLEEPHRLYETFAIRGAAGAGKTRLLQGLADRIPDAAPATVEEALAIARTRFRPLCRGGTPASVHIQEFDIGFLAYAVFPPTEPRSFGGSHLVISKADGRLTFVPDHPPHSAMTSTA
ncbi:hypothetical protein [Streptomyces sp. NRRL S-1813]|uniref:hypothetical protein n=1 Tax=Streptomyces sp. NRRL S-1813 TaxID=1463888 RepID=UPI0006903F58|nr:hypothetical protein [Streptomyces sp. NRRL S-1813]